MDQKLTKAYEAGERGVPVHDARSATATTAIAAAKVLTTPYQAVASGFIVVR